MRGQLGNLCCRRRPGEWEERGLPRRTQRCETDRSRGQRASLIKANFPRYRDMPPYTDLLCRLQCEHYAERCHLSDLAHLDIAATVTGKRCDCTDSLLVFSCKSCH